MVRDWTIEITIKRIRSGQGKGGRIRDNAWINAKQGM